MYIDRRFRSAGDYTMAVSEKSVQPQGGVYGWYAERNADSIAIYIGRAGKGGTLCRGVNEMLRTPFTSNDHTQNFGSLDTNFAVGTAISYFEKNGWCSTWRHLEMTLRLRRIT